MDTVVQIELEEVFTAIRNCESAGEAHKRLADELISLFNIIEENVSGGNIDKHVTTIIDNLTMCSDKLKATSDEAVAFAKEQINAYISTYDGAKKMFERAMAIIAEYNEDSWISS